MNCPSEIKWMELADGELESNETYVLESHAKQCSTCCATLEAFREINALGKDSLRISTEGATVLTELPTQRTLWTKTRLALVATCAVAALLSWRALDDKQAPPNGSAITSLEPETPAPSFEIDPSHFSDEAFEDWAAPYKLRRAPLISLHDVPQYFADNL